MKDFYKKEAIQIVKSMLKAFFVEKNVEGVLKYVNPQNFTWIGIGEHEFLTDIDEIRKHFQTRCADVANAYKISGEEYILKNFSSDSCIVIAKVKFRGQDERQNYESTLHFSFYLQLVDDKLLVSHYHVHIPVKQRPLSYSQHFMIDKRAGLNESIQMDFQFQDELLHRFIFNEQTPMKSFFYENDFPYCYVNQSFLNLFGFDSLKNFLVQEPLSSLSQIHPEDQERYLNHLRVNFSESLKLSLQEWKWHASYKIIYRAQTFDKEKNFYLSGEIYSR